MFGDRDVEVVGSTAHFESLAAQLLEVEADIVLVEAPGEQFEGVIDSLAASQLASEATIVVLSDHSEPRWFADALRAGVRALLPSDISSDQLVAALEAAAAGLVVMHPVEVDAMFALAESASHPLAELAEPLTRRESEVLQMLASGLANKEIAARLTISEHTVKFHVAAILGKLGAGSRTEAVSIGIRRGLVLL
jgi:NarL family two-component system response regulator YdfI